MQPPPGHMCFVTRLCLSVCLENTKAILLLLLLLLASTISDSAMWTRCNQAIVDDKRPTTTTISLSMVAVGCILTVNIQTQQQIITMVVISDQIT